MALINKLIHQALERDSKHTEVDCTYSFVVDDNGKQQLQIDTYGSSDRKILGKKSQSIRFSPEAIEQLKQILNKF
ncbi:hypothetical protein QEH52_17390 [Coraliomargarita sp. SDUM461003]|uniref:Methionyl-tRNA formyltransferase n=1 Tax=Thalassobacterium maritimum TaxID=3041265 RepID=A0ABU1AYU7_9BACT|nr:hypothetical protein [Coraliomargarita sp. SDUM461003]MDQ8209305.1 hypothetical protein [Coraliomargarita sp. SDUM461003]